MRTLEVSQIDDDVFERLSARAAEHGVSVEEEARQLIVHALMAPRKLGSLALELFGKEHGVELELPPREVVDPPRFGE